VDGRRASMYEFPRRSVGTITKANSAELLGHVFQNLSDDLRNYTVEASIDGTSLPENDEPVLPGFAALSPDTDEADVVMVDDLES
jgi:hypothetical protein